MSTIEAKTDTYNLEQITLLYKCSRLINPGLFLKITGTWIRITKKGPGFAGLRTGIPVGHYSIALQK